MPPRRTILDWRVRDAKSHAPLLQVLQQGGSPITFPVVPCSTVAVTTEDGITLGPSRIVAAVKADYGIVDFYVMNKSAGTTAGFVVIVVVDDLGFALPEVSLAVPGSTEILSAGWVDQVQLQARAIVGAPQVKIGYSIRLGTS
jgi:hypothetical protein